MHLIGPFLFLLLISSVARATPSLSTVDRLTGKATLKFFTAINTIGFDNLAEKDRARAQSALKHFHISKRDSGSSRTFSVTNAAVCYTAEIGVGTPPTNYTLLIDTGSSNTWVGARSQYIPTSSSVDTGGIMWENYGYGTFVGEVWLDTVTLSPDLVIGQQTIGVANWTHGFNDIDGILGLGPTDLTVGTVSNAPGVATVADNLYSQRTIPQEVLGIFFAPASGSDTSGELTFGGYDNSVTTSSVNYAPLTTTFPASEFWGIDQSISYGGTTILSSTSGIVDTGTTLILIATTAFRQYQTITGAALDPTTGLLRISSAQYANLQPLSFNIGGTSYDLIPNAQIWPRALNHVMGGNSHTIYLVVNDIGFPDGLAFDFVNGYTFLERYYSVFDTERRQFGIAETIYTNAYTN